MKRFTYAGFIDAECTGTEFMTSSLVYPKRPEGPALLGLGMNGRSLMLDNHP